MKRSVLIIMMIITVSIANGANRIHLNKISKVLHITPMGAVDDAFIKELEKYSKYGSVRIDCKFNPDLDSVLLAIQKAMNIHSLDIINFNGKALPFAIYKFPGVQSLSIESDSIQNLAFDGLNISKLKSLIINCKNATNIEFGKTPLRSLVKLTLILRNLKGVPTNMDIFTSVKKLRVSFPNELFLAHILNQIQSLECLILEDFDSVAFHEINIPRLISLGLINCKSIELDAIASKIDKSMADCSIINCNINRIPESFGKFTNLLSLTISGNRFTEVPAELERFTQLRTLSINEAGLTEISAIICNCADLIELDLSGTSISRVPECLNRLSSLYSIDLSGTRINSNEFEKIRGKLHGVQVFSKPRSKLVHVKL